MLAGENGILTYHIDDALEQINQSEDGVHHLIIYPELSADGTVYKIYQTQLKHEHKLVLILPHYETADNVRNILFDTA